MWREGEGKRARWRECPEFGPKRQPFVHLDGEGSDVRSRQGQNRAATNSGNRDDTGGRLTPPSTSRNDRRALELGNPRGDPLRTLGALAQHPPLKRARAHERETAEYALADLRIFRDHQANRLDQAGTDPRL